MRMIEKYDNVRIHLLRVHKRISCVYTRDLFQGLGPAQRLFWVPGPWGPWPRACTRVLCMHKRSLVYTQEIFLCTRNKCILTLSYLLIILISIYPLVQPISLTTYNPSFVLTYICYCIQSIPYFNIYF